MQYPTGQEPQQHELMHALPGGGSEGQNRTEGPGSHNGPMHAHHAHMQRSNLPVSSVKENQQHRGHESAGDSAQPVAVATGDVQYHGAVATGVNSASGAPVATEVRSVNAAGGDGGGGMHVEAAGGATTQELLELLGSDSGESSVSADSFGEPYDRSVGIMQRRVTAVRPPYPKPVYGTVLQ